MTMRAMTRRGFTLVELLLSLVVTAIVGAALVRMVLSQARFMDQQEAWRGARTVARGGINRLLSDLRNVEAVGGVEAAVAGGQDFTIRVPYALGVLCGISGGGNKTYTLTLMPVDSAMFAAPGYSGFAWRDSLGVYHYQTNTTLTTAGTVAQCQTMPDSIWRLPSINGSPASKVIDVTNTPGAINPIPKRGSIFLLYRRIRYEFKNSAALPGRTGLWRTMVTSGETEELATPFAATARANFYVLNSAAAQSAVPGTLGDIRGLELKLDGMSERTPGGSAAPKTVNMTTAVFFENRPD